MTERLSALDASFLYLERPGLPMNIGGLVVLDRPAGVPPPTLSALRARLAERVLQLPRLRQRLSGVPFDIGRPVWVDDPEFAIGRHVTEAVVAEPSWDSVLRFVERRQHDAFDLDHPVWDLCLLHGLPHGRVVLHVRFHHAMVDGIRAIALVLALFDRNPATVVPGPSQRAAADPSDLAFEASIEWYAAQLDRAARATAAAVDPLAATRADARLIDELMAFFERPGPGRSPFTGPVSALRRHATATLPSATLRDLRRLLGLPRLDTAMTLVAGALARQFAAAGTRHDTIRTLLPLTRPLPVGAPPYGNHAAFCLVDLPCGPMDDVQRAHQVATAVAEARRSAQYAGSQAQIAHADADPPGTNALVADITAEDDGVGLVVSYLPGPRRLPSILGLRHVVTYPLLPLARRIGLLVGIVDIGGQVGIGITADPLILPSPRFLAESVRATSDALLDAAVPPAPGWRPASGVR